MLHDVEGTQEAALKLLEMGYVPLRIDPDSKACRHPGWQIETPTEESVNRSFTRPSNLGVRCGDVRKDGTCLIGIDVDLDNAEIIRCVQRALGDERIPVKKGKKGATYIFRLDREHKTTKIKWKRQDKSVDAIDILCKGAQTVVPPSIHPDTQLPYRWISGDPLWELDYRSLPVYSPAVLDEIRGFCKDPDDPIYALNDMEWAGVGGGGNTHDTCVRAVSSMVARKWTDSDIHDRIQRAKREACEAADAPYNWPEAQKVIQEWIDSSRDKKFDKTSKVKVDDIPMEIINRYVYVISVDRMYDINKGSLVSMPVFNNMHARDVPKPWVSVLMHPDFKMVDRLTYAPGQPRFCRERSFDHDAVLDCLNVYSHPGVSPEQGDVEPFLELVNDVFDNNDLAVNHVLSFFAHLVQRPGGRINHALVIQGEQGIGKDSVLLAVEKVLGIHNCSQVTLQHVESQFNDWLFGKQLIVFQEMLATGRRNIYNKLKTYITDPVHTVNTKHLQLQRIPNRAAYVFLTNYKHALSLDPSDRRMWVWYSRMERKSPSYYQRYYDWLADDRSISALLQFLLDYDISAFKPSAPPPMTEAKQALVEASASEVEQFLRQAVENESWPMGCDLVSLPHLHGALRPFMRASLSMINEALDSIEPNGCLEQRPRIGGTRLRFRAVRNADRWKSATTDEIRSHYRMPVPPQMGETEGSYQVYEGSDLVHEKSSETDQY